MWVFIECFINMREREIERSRDREIERSRERPNLEIRYIAPNFKRIIMQRSRPILLLHILGLIIVQSSRKWGSSN